VAGHGVGDGGRPSFGRSTGVARPKFHEIGWADHGLLSTLGTNGIELIGLERFNAGPEDIRVAARAPLHWAALGLPKATPHYVSPRCGELLS
jgi:hypothetical protein